MLVRGVVARRYRVQMLAIDLQPGISPFADELTHQVQRTVDRLFIRGAKIEAVPPRDILRRPFLVEQQHISMVVQQIGTRRRSERCKPQTWLEALRTDVSDQL